jgi:hypothetical protein
MCYEYLDILEMVLCTNIPYCRFYTSSPPLYLIEYTRCYNKQLCIERTFRGSCQKMADVGYVGINEDNANPSQHVSSGEERRKFTLPRPTNEPTLTNHAGAHNPEVRFTDSINYRIQRS